MKTFVVEAPAIIPLVTRTAHTQLPDRYPSTARGSALQFGLAAWWSFCLCLLLCSQSQMLQFGGVSLSYLRQQLEEGCTEHSLVCCAPPQFAVDGTAGVDNLIMKCKVRKPTTRCCYHQWSVGAAELLVACSVL